MRNGLKTLVLCVADFLLLFTGIKEEHDVSSRSKQIFNCPVSSEGVAGKALCQSVETIKNIRHGGFAEYVSKNIDEVVMISRARGAKVTPAWSACLYFC